jgi:uncharacterized repeat protein (TIGR03803 family)
VRQLETRLTPSTLVSLASFGSPNGAYPYAGLVMDGSGNLYGAASQGGVNGNGTIFEIAHGSNTITTLAAFNGTNGQNPQGTLIMDASGNLYGTTYGGGASKDGTVFELAKGSSTITTLASFSGSNGQNPAGGLVMDGSGNLYGTAYGGGASGDGTVFEVVAGSGKVTTLGSFNGTNGSNPQDGLVLDASGNLYGTAYGGGASGDGTVFEVVANSGAITALASFNSTNGSNPYSSLVLDSSGNLYGTAYGGGASSDGTVFEVVAGSGTITALASFNYTDGADPLGGLVMDGNGNLYGTTSFGGGGSSEGTVFEVAKGSGQITMLAPMIYPGGVYPEAGVILDASGNLYGTTLYGGVGYGGTVYKLAKGATQTTTLASFSTNGADPFGGMVIDSKGNLYGTTAYGGASDSGTIFEIAAGSNTVTTLVSFGGITGQYPFGNLLMDGSGNLWGTASGGGLNGDGTIFELQSGQTAITMVASFSNTTGTNPQCGLVMDSSGNMFGTTPFGGASGYGTIWELPARRAGGIINTIASFNGTTQGANPFAGLAIDSSGNLYGATPYGGASGYGTVFEVAKGTNTINVLASFDYNNTGGYSYANLIVDGGGNLYGTASSGGAGGSGTVFEVVKGSGAITPLASFNYSNGGGPNAGLIMDSRGNLYGTASYGGQFGSGTVFTVVAGSGTITTVADFNYTDGADPYAPVVMDSKGILYGTTAFGGNSGNGTVFEVVPPDQWTGANFAVDTNWSDGANWSLGTAPAAGQQVNFTNNPSVLSFTSTVDAGFTNTIGDLDIDSTWGGTITANSALNVGGSLALASGSLGGSAAVTVAGSASDWTGGQIVVGAGGFTNTGTFLADTTAASLVVTGAGLLNNTGTMDEGGANSLELENNAVLSNAKGATFDITGSGSISQSGGGSVTNAGLLEKTGTGISTIASTTLGNTGTVEVTHGTLDISAAVAQAAGKTLTAGTWTVSGNGKDKVKLDITSDRHLTTIGSRAKVTLSGLNTIFANLSGLTTIAGGGSFSLLAGQSFTTAGALTDNGKLTLGPGSVLTVSGSFTETSTGVLTVEIGGTNSVPTFGQLVSTTGTVTLAGSLSVTTTVVPAVGSAFELLDNEGDAPIVGTFSGLPRGTTFNVLKGKRTLHFKITYVGTDTDGNQNVVITRVR